MTPELCPLWCAPTAASFSRTVTRSPGRASSRAIAVPSPTSPAPITSTSQPSRPAISGSTGWTGNALPRRPDPVSQDPDAGDLEFHGIAGHQPPAVVVLQDAAGAHRARADHVARSKLGVPRRLGQYVRPGVVQVGQIPPGPFLAIDPGRHHRRRAVELVHGDQHGTQAGREVLGLGRAQAYAHLLALDVPCRPVI